MAGIPPYLRIRDSLSHQLTTGAWPPGTRLPAEGELARHYGVARMTIRRALADLATTRLITRRPGVGTFVRTSSNDRSLNRLTSLTEDLRATGTVSSRVLARIATRTAPGEVMASLGLGDDAVVIQLHRIRLLNGQPVAIQTAYLPYGLCPAVLDGPLIDDSLYATLAARAGVELGWAHETIGAVALNDHHSALLDLPLGSPALHIVRLTYDSRNTPIEYVESFMRPERRFTVELKR